MLYSDWGPPIRRRTDTSISTYVFQDLNFYSDIRIEIKGLGHGLGTPDFLVQLSSDNGTTWDSTHYIHGGATGTNGFIFATAVPTAATVTIAADVEIYHLNQSLVNATAKINGGRENAAGSARTADGYISATGTWNAVQVTNSTGVNFTAITSILLFAKGSG